MQKFVLPTYFCLSAALPSFAQTDFTERPATFRLSSETIKLPGDEKMGLIGGSYLIETLPNIYLGPAAYGANSGRRGGFFTGGVELAWRQRLLSKIDLETGFYVGGGGGGGSEAVGGGLMLRPHADLLWDFGKLRAGLGVSSVRYPNGSIRSNQLGLIFALDDVFRMTAPGQAGRSVAYPGRGGVGFDQISVLGGIYQPRGNSRNTAGQPQDRVGFAGFRADQYLTENWLWGIEAAGAASGGADGYAEVLGSLGAELPLIDKRLAVGARASLGMGGGGSIDTGGGALAKAGLYSTLRLNRDYFVTAEGGLAHAPTGHFRAQYATLQLGVMLDQPHFGQGSAPLARIEDWQWSAGMQHYQNAARRDGSSRPMDVITVKMDRHLNPNVYLTGQAHSGTHGGAGAYSVGLFGAGITSPKTRFGLSASAELLVGAAGGGGVHTQGGAITQPMLYATQDIGKNWALRAGTGKIKSIRGELNSTVYDVSLGYTFGLGAR